MLAGHSLQFFPGAPAEGPPPAAKPAHSWELVGAHLRMEKKQELGLTPAGGSAAVSFSMPDERQAQEWMVGLAAVPGLFRCGCCLHHSRAGPSCCWHQQAASRLLLCLHGNGMAWHGHGCCPPR